MSELNLILLGPPGAGKGTQAQRLREDFSLPYFATGDILRQAVKEGTELGRQASEYMQEGDLVPDSLVTGIIKERLEQPDSDDGFILDGFPRTVPQAEALDQELATLGRGITAVINIALSEEEAVRRLSGRRVCVKGGHNFHVEFDPPKHEDRCDVDGSRLIVRDDDKPETVRHRLSTYHEKTEPLVEFYERKGVLREVDGAQGPAEVHNHIRALIATLRFEESV